ncbi:MAG: glycosyltransferase family 9 protein [Spirochaetes bacterium]|nr:glycosyltransferase family 9 protein [Spirochaetota bacterium]
MERILIAETDRVGDVILSLPVFKSIKKYDRKIYVVALVSPYTRDLFRNFKYADGVIEYFDGDKNSLENTLLKIRSQQFDTALILHPDKKVAKLLQKAEIKNRISYGWKWYQYLFTDVLVQHRSRNRKHQLEYNLDLLKYAGIDVLEKNIKLEPDLDDIKFVNGILRKKKLYNKRLIGIHPGSGRSSLSLSAEKYAELIMLLKKNYKNTEIVLTHTPRDKQIIDRLISTVKARIHLMPENLSLTNLMALLSRLKVFISNSTGPLHMASALRVPAIGFYSPVFVHSPRRWGPYWGYNLVIRPEVNCPEKWRCRLEKCKYYDCFHSIDFKPVIKFVGDHLK